MTTFTVVWNKTTGKSTWFEEPVGPEVSALVRAYDRRGDKVHVVIGLPKAA